MVYARPHQDLNPPKDIFVSFVIDPFAGAGEVLFSYGDGVERYFLGLGRGSKGAGIAARPAQKARNNCRAE